VAALIREAKTHMVLSVMQTGRGTGMMTFSDELTRLAAKGLISAEDAYNKAVDKSDIETKFLLAGLSLDFKKKAEEAAKKAKMAKSRELLDASNQALADNPNNIQALCSAAWIMAASPFNELRDGKRAVKLAEIACSISHEKDPLALSVLGIALAEFGSFRRAIDATRKAAALHSQAGDNTKANALISRVSMFEQNKPYRDE